jgi:NADH-quinone oxidoreductase subunit K
MAFIALADAWGGPEGRVFVFFVIIVAAAEAAIGLGIVITLYRLHGSIDLDRADLMRG